MNFTILKMPKQVFFLLFIVISFHGFASNNKDSISWKKGIFKSRFYVNEQRQPFSVVRILLLENNKSVLNMDKVQTKSNASKAYNFIALLLVNESFKNLRSCNFVYRRSENFLLGAAMFTLGSIFSKRKANKELKRAIKKFNAH